MKQWIFTRSKQAVVAAAAAGMLVTGCADTGVPDQVSGPAPEQATQATSLSTLAQPSSQVQAARLTLAHMSTLDYLPPDTKMVAGARHLEDVMRLAGLPSLIADYRASGELDDVRREMRKDLGFDLTDPDILAQMGFDPAGSAGLAWAGYDRDVMVLFAEVADERLFDAAVHTVLGQANVKSTTEVVGDATIVMPQDIGDEPAVAVRRDGYAYLVLGNWNNEEVVDVAFQIATQEPDSGLSQTQAFRAAVDGVSFGRDAGAFLNLPAIVAQLRDSLQEDIDRFKEHMDAEDEWSDRHVAEMQSAMTLLEATLGSLGGAVLGAEVEQGRISTRGLVSVGADTLLSRLVKNSYVPSHLQRGLAEAPLYLFEGQVDTSALRELSAMFAATVGADFEQGMQWVKAFGSLDGDPFSVLSGELGFAVSSQDGHDPGLGFTASLGFADAEVGRRLVDRIGGMATLAGMVEYNETTGGVTIDTNGWHPIHIFFADGAMIATTDISVHERLATPNGPRFATHMRPDLGHRLDTVGVSGRWSMDFGMFDDAFHTRTYEYTPHVAHEVEGDSPRMRGLRAELRQVSKDLNALENAHRQQRATLGRQLLDTLGTAALTAKVTPDGLVMEGGWFLGQPSLGTVVRSVVDGTVKMDRMGETNDETEGPLRTRFQNLIREIQNLQQEQAQ